MTKRLTIPLLLLAMLIGLLPSCERESRGAIDYTYQAIIEKAPVTKAFYFVNQPYVGKLSLNIDPRNESKIETAFLTDANGYALIGEDKKKIQPGETFMHDYRESAIPIEVYLATIGTNEIRFDFMSERFSASVTDTIQVKDLHYTITVDSLPDKMLVGKKFSFRLNIEEKEQTSNMETTASGTITKGAGIMYVGGDKILISKPNEIVTDLKDVLPETKAGENVQTLSIGRNVLTYLPQLDELNEINLKVNNPYQSSQNFSMSFNIEKPIFGTEAIIDKKSIPYVRKDYSFLLKVFQVDVYEGNTYNLTYRFLKSTAKLKINATDLHQGETLKVKEGENIIVINSEIKENCDIEFVISDKYGSQYKDTAIIDFQALPMYNVVVPESEGGTIVGPGSYEESSTATLTATASTGYTFTGFYTPDNTLISSNPEYSFTVLEDKTIKAVFKKNIYKIDAIAGEGGSVTGGNSYEFASNVTLKAKPNNGYSFAGWHEAEQLVSSDETYSFQAAGNRSLIGRFKLNKLSLATDPVSKECSTGEAVSFNLTLNEDGYTGTFKVFYQVVSGEGTFSGKESQILAKGSHPMRYTPERAGTHTLNFRAVDDNGQEETVNITITAAATDLKASCNLTETSIKQNETADLSMTIEEENHPKKFALTYGLSNGTGKLLVNGTELGNTSTVELAAGNHKLRYTASNVGTATLKFTIADSRGQKKEVTTKVISKADIKATAGEHGSVTGSGAYALNDKVNLQATPETGYGFSGWFENGTNVSNDVSFTFPATTSRTLQARFGTNLYKVSVIAGDGGTVSGSGSYEFGTQQTITATPATGYSFDSWSDHKEDSETPKPKARAATTDNAIKRVITITAENKSYIAAFKKNQYIITVKAGEGGTATGGGTFDFGTDHTITATAKDGHKFEKWSDNNSEPSRSVRVEASDATYTAEFTSNKYEIKLVAGDGGTVTGAGSYNFGTEQTITATPKAGYNFVKWDDGDTNATRKVRIEAKDVTYTATFATNKYAVTVKAGEGGTVSGAGSYDFGTEQTITATPKPGYKFVKWDDGDTNATRKVRIEAKDVTYTATFTTSKYEVKVVAGEGGTVSGAGFYDFGTEQTITATPKPGYKFVKWDDGDTNASKKIRIEAKDAIYTAEFTTNKYEVKVVAGEGGTVSGAGFYDFGTEQTITATAKTGYSFSKWGDDKAEAATYKAKSFALQSFPKTAAENEPVKRTIVIKAATVTYTAEFTPNKYLVNVMAGDGGTVSGTGTYPFGTRQTITATAKSGYEFTRWDDGNTDASRQITIEAGDKTYTASFAIKQYEVTAVSEDSNGSVTGGKAYDYNTVATLRATPKTGYNFAGWYEAGKKISEDNPYSFPVSKERSITGKFEISEHFVTVTSGGNGTVTGSGLYKHGAQATITAKANTGYSFAKWSDDNTDPSRVVLVDKDITYVGLFSANKYPVTVNAGTGGTVTGSGSYDYGTLQTITATASTGYTFTKWNDGDKNAIRNILISSAPITYTATFTPNKYVITVTAGTGGTVAGGGSYDFATQQTITATAGTGYHFVKWDDDNTQASRQVTIGAEDKTYTASFAPNKYMITVTGGTGGTVSGSGSFNYGSQQTITATAGTGYSFTKWNDGNTDASRRITIGAEDKTYTASFTPNKYTITITAGTGGTATGSGSFDFGSQQTITATAGTGYSFTRWSDGSTDASRRITIGAEDKTYTASFTPNKYTITVTAGTGGTVSGSGSFDYGTQQTITATAGTGYSFTRWSDGSTDASRRITVGAENKTYTATFTPNKYVITVTGGAGGTVSGSGSYDYGTQQTITATPSTGYHFVKWDDGNTQASRQVSVGASNMSYAATFAINQYAIDATAGAGGTVKGGGTYNHGAAVTLTATPNNGYNFSNWSEVGTNVSNSASYSFEATKSRTLLASFRKNEITASVDKPSQAVKVGQAAPIQLSISEPNYEGLFTVRYDQVSGSGTFSGGASQTVGAGSHSMSYTPSTAGTHTYQLTIIDQYGTNKTVNVTVTATLSPIVLQPNQTSFSLGLNGEATVSLAISEVAYSDRFTLRYDHSGASGTFKVNDLVLASGLTTSVSAGTATLKFQIGQVGDANLRITVSDTRGQSEAVNIKVNATSTISVSAGAGGSASGGGTYSTLGASATVTASPATGYSFAGWYEGGTYVSGSASYSFAVTNSRALEARFSVNSYTLTVVANPAAGGTVTGSGTYPYGSSQTITATGNTASYYYFTNWNDGNTSPSRVVTIGASNVTYTANFTYDPPKKQPINLTSSGSGTVYINGKVLSSGDQFEPGTYTLTAVPASGWSSDWTTKSITIVDRPVPVSVTFTQNITYTLTINAKPSNGTYSCVWLTVDGTETRQIITGTGQASVLIRSFDPGTTVTITRFKTHVIYNSMTYAEALETFNKATNFGSLSINGSSYGISSTMTVTMSGDKTINCTF